MAKHQRALNNKRVVVLGIRDDYALMEPLLVSLLWTKLCLGCLPKIRNPAQPLVRGWTGSVAALPRSEGDGIGATLTDGPSASGGQEHAVGHVDHAV